MNLISYEIYCIYELNTLAKFWNIFKRLEMIFFLLKSVTYRVSATLLNTKNNFQTKVLVTSGALNLSLCWRCLSLYIPWAGCALQHILYPKTQGMEEGKESGRTRKGIRKITSPTLWDYDSTSLILELKPLCTAFDCATCSFIHTHPLSKISKFYVFNVILLEK